MAKVAAEVRAKMLDAILAGATRAQAATWAGLTIARTERLIARDDVFAGKVIEAEAIRDSLNGGKSGEVIFRSGESHAEREGD